MEDGAAGAHKHSDSHSNHIGTGVLHVRKERKPIHFLLTF
jgi:hypothetical protein